jgi:arylformamidase
VSDFLATRQDWRRLDAAELARQYSARGTVPDAEVFIKDYRDHSTPMYALPHVRGARYGEHADEVLDLFPVPGKKDAPIFVFVHGGYWRSLGREDSAFMAKAFTQRGIAVAVVNYTLSPEASLAEIVAQCRRSVAWLYRHGAAHGVDVNRIVVAGSSAGGHLGGMLIAQGWQAELGLPPDVVKGAALVSGLFDLAPVQQTTPNQWLGLSEAEALALSPMESLPLASVKLCIAVAGIDTDEFKRQSLMYAQACRRRGCEVSYLDLAERNHFDVITDWMDSESELSGATWALFESA